MNPSDFSVATVLGQDLTAALFLGPCVMGLTDRIKSASRAGGRRGIDGLWVLALEFAIGVALAFLFTPTPSYRETVARGVLAALGAMGIVTGLERIRTPAGATPATSTPPPSR